MLSSTTGTPKAMKGVEHHEEVKKSNRLDRCAVPDYLPCTFGVCIAECAQMGDHRQPQAVPDRFPGAFHG